MWGCDLYSPNCLEEEVFSEVDGGVSDEVIPTHTVTHCVLPDLAQWPPEVGKVASA
jgi:hypothetical protein